ncbi:hypothetical protein JCM19538_2608 [Jejuia pallidilutea]|jgi:hypothetical protein|uniref:Uncharacterized protein n=1 Tax=Jejuia pallidilutea TaxID=504487 RepID=A0A098LMS3_9FLAO|nr:hypothetical protein CLV33_10596 [Jejuia pallidilutea]GAL88245.1 hypothetical protein JCM19538_2608 [Jejuia pallidilutea]
MYKKAISRPKKVVNSFFLVLTPKLLYFAEIIGAILRIQMS